MPLVLLAIAAVPAAWGTNCGDAILPRDYGPTTTEFPYAYHVWAYFTDDAPRCGIVEHHVYIDGREIFSSVANPPGEYGVFGQDFSTPLLPGPHLVRAEIVEACCGSTGLPARGIAEWVMVVTSTAATGYSPNVYSWNGECTLHNDVNGNFYPDPGESLATFPCPADRET